jgi:peptidoglycan/xylan/chitin deacetylase (PgdA/CDA1 family)
VSEQIKVFFAACLYYSGLAHLARWWMQRSTPRLIILNYHQATGGDLRSHLLHLRRHYRMLHLEAALEELYSPPKKTEQRRDRRTPLVLTFDDGYRDNYTHAFTLACELQVPITIFLVPGYVDSGSPFPWLEGTRLAACTTTDKITLEGHTYQLDHPAERNRLAQAINFRLLHAKSIAERAAFLTAIRTTLAIFPSVTLEEQSVLPLTWDEIREMEESGWVSFGAHTVHHPMLAELEDPLEVEREIGECRTILEQKLGHSIRLFAYPFGQPHEVGKQAPQAAKKAGYDWVLTTVYGINTPRTDPQQLHRIYGDTSRHWLMAAVQASGVLHLLMTAVSQQRKE